jgi:hypothetical protein
MADIVYKKTAFVLLKPPSRIISIHIPKNKSEHTELLQKARDSGYCLYYAPAESRNGKYVVQQPWQLDWDSIPKEPELVEEPSEPVDELKCPFCGKKVNSTPGRTLHVKSSHPDKMDEYKKWQNSLGKK